MLALGQSNATLDRRDAAILLSHKKKWTEENEPFVLWLQCHSELIRGARHRPSRKWPKREMLNFFISFRPQLISETPEVGKLRKKSYFVSLFDKMLLKL